MNEQFVKEMLEALALVQSSYCLQLCSNEETPEMKTARTMVGKVLDDVRWVNTGRLPVTEIRVIEVVWDCPNCQESNYEDILYAVGCYIGCHHCGKEFRIVEEEI